MPSSNTSSDPHVLAGRIKAKATELGFDRVGIAPAAPSAFREYLRQWLDQGQHGTMSWMNSRFDERTDPGRYLGGAQSVICVALNYYARLEEVPLEERPQAGRVARYSLGVDYHQIIKQRLYDLADWIRDTFGGRTRCAVDTAPVMEKELAARAGVGWIGKNSCLINEGIGSWILLGEVMSTLTLAHDLPAIDRCGTCRRCIDACPTGAITAPYQLDARKCISYLTIEHAGEVDPALAPRVGDWVYGCDICQDVCPWNGRAPIATDPQLAPRFRTGTVDVRQVAGWTIEDYRQNLRHSAMKRVKLPVLQRNAAIVRRNKGETGRRET